MEEHYRLVALSRGAAHHNLSQSDEECLTIAVQEILNSYQQLIGRYLAEKDLSRDPRVWLDLCEDGSRLMIARDPAAFLYPYSRRS